MKAVSVTLKAHFGQATTTLAMLWKVTRADSTVLGFTNFDNDIVYSGVTYKASSGFLPTANETQSDMAVDNLEVTGFLDASIIKETDIRNGVYDYAKVEQHIINWADLTQGDVIIRKGIIGNIKMMNGLFMAEIRGLTQYLSTNVGALFGPLCRAELFSTPTNDVDPTGHYFCYVKEADYIQNGSVNTAADARTIVPTAGLLQIGSATPSAPAPSGWFNDGELKFTSGTNSGFAFEIKTWDGTTLALLYPMPNPPVHNDTFTIEPGCDKTPTVTGCLKFNGYSSDGLQTIVATTNIMNFRGEPQIPGMDLLTDYPSPK